MDNDIDQPLVAACRRGDRAAFATLVRRYQKPVYNAAYRVLGNADDASDTTQEVFLRVAQKLGEYDEKYRFFSWLYRIAVNESIDLLRRNRREQPLDGEEDLPGPLAANPEAQLEAAQSARRIQSAMMRMRPEERAVIALRHFSELSYREIADVLEVDEKTVKSRIYEARGRMRTMLKDLRDTIT